MAYRLSGTYYAPCSCEVACPCDFGELEGDDGYCSGVIAARIDSGDIDGVDVGGIVVALAADWPKGFLSGDGTGRMYVDPSTSTEQREALERVFTGKAGGDLEGLGALVPNFLPAREASIELETTDGATRLRVGDIGEGVIDPIRNDAGEITRVIAMPAAFTPETIFARGDGTHWSDPDLRQWESRGHAEQGDFEWTG